MINAGSLHSIAFHSKSMTGYVTAVLAFISGELSARKAISLWFFVMSCDFTTFFSCLTNTNPCVFKSCLIRSNIANLCPNMMHFDALDFCECRCRSDKFLLTPSVQWELKKGNRDSILNLSKLKRKIMKLLSIVVQVLSLCTMQCGCTNRCFVVKAPANAIMQSKQRQLAAIHGRWTMNNVPT